MTQVVEEHNKKRTFGGNLSLILNHSASLGVETRKNKQIEKKHLKAYLKGHEYFDFQKVKTWTGIQILPVRKVLVNFV